MGKTKAVVLWPETEQASTVPIEVVREEDRVEGTPTVILDGKKYHKAIIKLISDDPLKLKEREDEILAEIEDRITRREQELAQSTKRHSRHRRPAIKTGVASENQVASALGNRLKPTAAQASKVRELSTAKRAATKAQNDAQDDVDRQTVSKELFPNLNLMGEDGNDHENESDNESGEEPELMDLHQTLESNEPKSWDESKCCSHCKDLRKAYNQSGLLFVQALATFGRVSAPLSEVQYADLLPIPDSVPKCELSKHVHPKVYISIADKTGIKSNGEGDPLKMVRQTLTCLYGRDQLRQNNVTALGTKPGTYGIRKNVRDAILGGCA